MEHEAASVEDQGWARETRRAAWLLGWPRAVGVSAAVFAALGCGQVTGLLLWPQAQAWPHLWTATMLAVGALSLVLGRCGVRDWAVALGTAAFLPAAWMTVLTLQALWPTQAPMTPGFSDDSFRIAVLMVIAWNGAGLAHRLSDLRPPRRKRQAT
ncbi:hypothetical protein RDMS_08675 [Deinococcus sp. RL]|nr:hypothetical protein RDMS_08675 [Deinococcus sp. RL]